MPLKFTPLTLADVRFEVSTEPEDTAVAGQFDDPRDVAEIERRLELCDDSAWCCVMVTARWRGWRGTSTLGGCSLTRAYTAEVAARENGLYGEALSDLNRSIEASVDSLTPRLVVSGG